VQAFLQPLQPLLYENVAVFLPAGLESQTEADCTDGNRHGTWYWRLDDAIAGAPEGALLFAYDKFNPAAMDEPRNLLKKAHVAKVFAWYATAEEYFKDLGSAGACRFGYEMLLGLCRLHQDLEWIEPGSQHWADGGREDSSEGEHCSLREVVRCLREGISLAFGVSEAEIWVSCGSRFVPGKGYKHSYHITVSNVHTCNNIVQRGFFEEIFPAGHRCREFVDMTIYTYRRQMRTWEAEKMELNGAPTNPASKLCNITQNPYGDGGEDVYSPGGIVHEEDHAAGLRGLITAIGLGSNLADCSRLTPCTRAPPGSAPNPVTWSRNPSPET